MITIGESERASDFGLRLDTDDPLKKREIYRWNGIRVDSLDGAIPELKWQSVIYELLDENPRTETLGFFEGEWMIEGTIPPDVCDQLVDEILTGKANEIDIGIKLVGGKAREEHAPPEYPATWGYLGGP